MMLSSVAIAVPFDFDGSLQLARELWQFADQLRQLRTRRKTLAETALTDWLGAYADKFSNRMEFESSDLKFMEKQAREDAKAWASAWVTAMNQQNQNNRKAAVAKVRNHRSFAERNIGDRFVGDDSAGQVAGLPQISTPQPPNFHPTTTPTTF